MPTTYNITELTNVRNMTSLFEYSNKVSNYILADVIIFSIMVITFLVAGSSGSDKNAAMFITGFIGVILSVMMGAIGLIGTYSLIVSMVLVVISIALMYMRGTP